MASTGMQQQPQPQRDEQKLYKELKTLVRKHRRSLSPGHLEGAMRDLNEAMHEKSAAFHNIKFPPHRPTPQLLSSLRSVLAQDMHSRITLLSRRIEDAEKRIASCMNSLLELEEAKSAALTAASMAPQERQQGEAN